MRCKGCGYSLWNVPGRTCPECGRGFSPGEFEFLPNAVEFCCPGCMQQYYGTDLAGLPVPREFTCVRCSRPCTLETMVLRAAPGFSGDDAELRRIAWEVEGKGVARRFLAMLRDGMSRPGSVGLAVRHRCDGRKALRFVLLLAIASVVPTVVTFVAILTLPFLGAATVTRTGGVTFRSEFAELAGYGMLVVVASTVIGAGLLALWAWGAWLVVRLLGSRVPWRTAWCSLAYGSGPMVLVSVPCLGPYCGSQVSVIWLAVAASIILAAAGPVPGWKAAVGVVSPLVLMGCIGIGVPLSIAVLAPAWSAPAPVAAPVPGPADPGAPDSGAADEAEGAP